MVVTAWRRSPDASPASFIRAGGREGSAIHLGEEREGDKCRRKGGTRPTGNGSILQQGFATSAWRILCIERCRRTQCVFLQQNTSFGKFVDTNLAVNILKADTMYAWVTCMNEYLGPLWLPVKACEALVLSPWPSEANL